MKTSSSRHHQIPKYSLLSHPEMSLVLTVAFSETFSGEEVHPCGLVTRLAAQDLGLKGLGCSGSGICRSFRRMYIGKGQDHDYA